MSISSYELLVNWEDGYATWDPVSVMIRNYPIYLANYAKENELLNNTVWGKHRFYVKNTKNINLLIKADKSKQSRNTIMIKFL